MDLVEIISGSVNKNCAKEPNFHNKGRIAIMTGPVHTSVVTQFSPAMLRQPRILRERESERIAPHQHLSDFIVMLFLLLGDLLEEFGDLGMVGFDTPELLC